MEERMISHLHKNKYLFNVLALLSVATSMVACQGSQSGAQMPPPEVTVIKVNRSSMDINNTLTGRLEPVRKAEVRARIPGVLKKIYFQEGSYVKQGDPLFLIDDKPARAQVAQAQAQYTQATSQLNKISPLLQSGAVSRTEYDNARTNMQAAKATLQSARINLDYAHIKAPISGRIGKTYETEGALVGQGQPTLLAVIQQENPLKIDLNLSVNDYMKLKHYAQEAKSDIEGLPFSIILSDGTFYPKQGRILFTDTSINEDTGQITIKGEIQNQENLLLPGLFVKVQIKVGSIPNVFAIPVNAVDLNDSGGAVIVVNQDGTYALRQINIINQNKDYIYSTDGLKDGELVLIDGKMKLMLQPKKVTYKLASAVQTQANPPTDENTPTDDDNELENKT
ncbi:MAG: efflux RND transporter periplasmic adaptor subunit [Neisseriaceae bacterium]|nr:MAG: efflux RND transporter periplasmic adaptor subunit [Neisseriaceae bacterium]